MRKVTALFVLGCLLLAILIFFDVIHVSSSDQAGYDTLAREILEKHELRKHGEEKEVTRQIRKNVSKTIFFSEPKGRLEIELRGVRSEVGVFQKKSDAKLVETFSDASGFIQEELLYHLADGTQARQRDDGTFYICKAQEEQTVEKETVRPMQRIRYFMADVAIYDYHAETLIAYNIHFWTYIVPGHELIKDVSGLKAESEGTARSMTIHHMPKEGIQFSAENLNMEMVP